MMEYTKYIIFILIGIAITNIWVYIRHLEFQNEMLLRAVETKLTKQIKNSLEESDDTN